MMKRTMKKLVGASVFAFFLVLAMSVGAFAAPDLGITGLQASPSNVNPEEEVSVSIEVTNVGTNTSSGANISSLVSVTGSTVIEQDFDGYALDPGESQTFSFSWTPYTTGTYNIEASVSALNDSNSANDVASTSVDSTTSSGAVLISEFHATETLFADPSGCINQPLVVSGFVREDSEGTDDRVYIYVNNQLAKFVEANPSNDGYFRAEMSDLCFDEEGTYTVRADVDRGSGVIATASQDITVNFNPLGGGDGDGTPEGFYATDIEATPYTLNVGTGETDKYLLKMKNLGDETDTYFVEIEARDSKVDRWTSLSASQLELDPGEVKYAYLNVELPTDADLGKYPITVRMNGVTQDSDRVYLNVIKGENYDEGGGSEEKYEADLEVSPYELDIEAGESAVHTLKIENLGNVADEYELGISSAGKFHDWFEFEKDEVAVNPGETEYVDLHVNVPEGVGPQDHSFTIRADGGDTDVDRIKLNVLSRANTLDVEVQSPRLTPSQTWTDGPGTVEVKAPITFKDFETAEGDYVTVKLYVNGVVLNAKTPFVSSDQTKMVTFHFDTEDYPVENKEGEYETYMVARVGEETDKSPSSIFRVLKPGNVKINVSSGTDGESAEIKRNGSFRFDVEITNKDHEDNTYLLVPEGMQTLKLDPASVDVSSGEEKKVNVVGTIGNLTPGEYTATVKVKDEKDSTDSASQEIPLVVSEEFAGGGAGAASGVSGYLLFSNAGRGILVGLIILVVIGGYYFKRQYERTAEEGERPPGKKGLFDNFTSKGEEKEEPEKEESSAVEETNEEEHEPERKEPKPKKEEVKAEKVKEQDLEKMKAASKAISEAIREEAQEGGEKTELPEEKEKRRVEKEEPEEKESEELVWKGGEGVDLGKFNVMNEPVSEEGWSPRDAEDVLLNLDEVKEDFHEEVSETTKVKEKMGELAKKTGSKRESIAEESQSRNVEDIGRKGK